MQPRSSSPSSRSPRSRRQSLKARPRTTPAPNPSTSVSTDSWSTPSTPRRGSATRAASGIASRSRAARRSWSSMRRRSQKKPAFDHAAIAASLSKATGRPVDARNLPFNVLTFSARRALVRRRGRHGAISRASSPSRTARARSAGARRPRRTRRWRWRRAVRRRTLRRRAAHRDNSPRVSPDGKTEASIRNFNVFTRGDRRARVDAAVVRRLGSERVLESIALVVARLEEARRLSRQARLQARSALRDVEPRGSDPAEGRSSPLQQARRRARRRPAGAVRSGDAQADRDLERALPERVRA